MYYIYATNISIIDKNTVFTRACPGDQTKVNLVAIYNFTYTY